MPPDDAPDTTFTGLEARALAVAHAAFAETGHDLRRYAVVLRSQGASCEIVFVPEQEPGRSVRGGETSAGREIHYHVNLDSGLLERTHFAR